MGLYIVFINIQAEYILIIKLCYLSANEYIFVQEGRLVLSDRH